MAIARSNSYEVDSRFIQEVPALSCKLTIVPMKNSRFALPLGHLASARDSRTVHQGSRLWRRLLRTYMYVFCLQAAAKRLRKSVEVVASPTSGCSEIEMRGIKHADKPGPGTPIATDRDPTPHD